MSKVVPILIATTLAASVACMHLVRELREERARNEALQSQLENQQRERVFVAPATSQTQEQPRQLPRAIDPPTPAREAITAESRSASRPESSTQAAMLRQHREHMERERQRFQDPQYRDAMRAQIRASLASHYPGLSELGLSREETDRLIDLLATQQVENMEHATFQHYGQEPMDPAALDDMHRKMQERQQQQQAEVEMQLGPTTYGKWQAYQETLGHRHRVAGLQSKLALAGVPMNAEQSKAVLAALVEDHRRQETALVAAGNFQVAMIGEQTISSEQTEKWLAEQERYYERLVSSLESILSSQQLEHLQQSFENEIEMNRASSQMQRAIGSEHTFMFNEAAPASAFVGSESYSEDP